MTISEIIELFGVIDSEANIVIYVLPVAVSVTGLLWTGSFISQKLFGS